MFAWAALCQILPSTSQLASVLCFVCSCSLLTQSVSPLQIGQVMLALPNAIANTGIRAGVPLLFVYSLFSIFTIHLLTALYAEYKARKVRVTPTRSDAICRQKHLRHILTKHIPWSKVIRVGVQAQVKAGTWEGGHNKKATQYFDVISDLVGFWPGRFVLLITIISLCSTGIAQVIACSTGAYYLDTRISKRYAPCGCRYV